MSFSFLHAKRALIGSRSKFRIGDRPTDRPTDRPFFYRLLKSLIYKVIWSEKWILYKSKKNAIFLRHSIVFVPQNMAKIYEP